MIINLGRASTVTVVSLLLSACGARAPYHAPPTRSAELKNADPAVFVVQPYDARWWTQFDDPILEALEDVRFLRRAPNGLFVRRDGQAPSPASAEM